MAVDFLTTETERYRPHATELSELLVKEPNIYVRAEYLGYVVLRIMRNFMQLPSSVPVFNSHHFHPDKKKILDTHGDKIAAQLNRNEPLECGNDLYQVIGHIWTAVGQGSSSFGITYLVRGVFQQVSRELTSLVWAGDEKSKTLHSRRKLISLGVLAHLGG